MDDVISQHRALLQQMEDCIEQQGAHPLAADVLKRLEEAAKRLRKEIDIAKRHLRSLDGSGQASSDSVDGSTTPSDLAVGKYCWRAEFTPGAGDHHFLPGSHTNSTTECFTVIKNSPTIVTTWAYCISMASTLILNI